MKLLQNKFVVGVLGMVAVAIVANNLGVFKSSKKFPIAQGSAEQSTVKKNSPSNKVAESINANTGSKHRVQIDQSLDIELIKLRLSRWVKAPGRDPFQHFSKQPDYAGVGAFLKLSAVWRQTRSRLAVINQKVLAEGDLIDDYRIERIEGDRVWVHGPIGLEPLELDLALTEARQDRKKVKLIAKQKR